jgi:predicted SAM-dependent methyltransferase
MKYLLIDAKALIPKKYHFKVKQIYYRFRSLFYIGNRFICPCCNGHFRTFLQFGIKSRPNALCPKCGSLERHRLLWLYLKHRTNLFSENLKVLHFAPEYIFQRTFKTMLNLDYISADLDSPIALVKIDITNILYKDNMFDAILCNHVLEHVLDDKKAMRELFRVLKPGGWAIIQVPIWTNRNETFEDQTITSPEQRKRIFGQPDDVRMYGKDYKDRLEKAGFVVKVDDYVKELDAKTIKKYCLMEDEDIYFCIKPNLKDD